MKEESDWPNHETARSIGSGGTYLSERAWGTVREITAPMATPGNTSRTTTPVHVFSVGTKTVWPASVIAIS